MAAVAAVAVERAMSGALPVVGMLAINDHALAEKLAERCRELAGG